MPCLYLTKTEWEALVTLSLPLELREWQKLKAKHPARPGGRSYIVGITARQLAVLKSVPMTLDLKHKCMLAQQHNSKGASL